MEKYFVSIIKVNKTKNTTVVTGDFFDSKEEAFKCVASFEDEIYTKYKLLGLFIFVAIPLPGTGAWTGAAIAALLKMRIKHSLPTIAAGVASAGVIMLVVSKIGEFLIRSL